MSPFAGFSRFGASIAAILLPALTACSGNVAVAPSSPSTATVECGNETLSFSMEVFGALRSAPQCEFGLGISTAAYVEIPNVAASDHYVLVVESSGPHPRCVYMSPKGRKAGPDGSCNVDNRNVAGVQAPGGIVSLTWVFSRSLQPGEYEIAVFDQDANGGAGEALGGLEVSLTSGGS